MAPTTMKRPAAAASVAGSRSIRRRTPDVVGTQCDSVVEALQRAPGLAAELRSMLVSLVPASLRVYRDERHDFQHRAVQMVEEALHGIEAHLKSDVEEARVPVEKASQDKSERAAALQAAEASLVKLSARVVDARAAVDSSAAAVKAAKTALAAASSAQEEGDAVLIQALDKKARLDDVYQQTFSRLRQEGLAKKADISLLTKVGREFNFDTSLLASMGPALEKESALRGTFDVVILDKLGAEFDKATQGLTKFLEEGGPGKAERATAVASAEEALATAIAAHEGSKASLAEASAQEKDGKTTRKAAESAVARFMTDVKKTMDAFDGAQCRLADFESGPRAAFAVLKELAPPTNPVEKTSAEESIQEQEPQKAHFGEEQTPSAEV